MIINKIRIQEEYPMTAGVTSWPLPICDLDLNSVAGENGYLIKNAVGLGPTQLTAVVEGFDASGIPIMDSVATKREIVIRIALVPRIDQTVSELRDALYKFMSRSVLVTLMNQTIAIARTKGYIKMFETIHFASQAEVQITIECEDGYFYGIRPVLIPLNTLNVAQPVINYEEGTAPAGFELRFMYTSVTDGTGFSISNHAKAWHVGAAPVNNIFAVTYPFTQGDVVIISTRPNDRRITLLRGSLVLDLAGYLNAGAVWPKLHSGVNSFTWSFNSSWMTWNAASYIPRYWGV